MELSTLLFIMIMAFFYLLALFTLPAWLIKKAMVQVVEIFRNHQATEIGKAKSVEELGLQTPGFLDRMGRQRDYKPIALRFLMSAKVVKETYDHKVFMSEYALQNLCCKDRENRLGLCRKPVEEDN